MRQLYTNDMNPIYREFQEDDLEALIELMHKLGYEHNKESLLHNVSAVRESRGEIFVAERLGQVCGCVCAILDVRLAEGAIGEIVSLVVNQSDRGKGVGRGLVFTAEHWLKYKVTTIRIRANVVREEAHTFYETLGYSLSKTQGVFSKSV